MADSKEIKTYIIRLRSLESSQSWSETSPDDYDYDSDDFAIDGGSASMDGDYAETVKDIIGDRGEYIDWLELSVDEVFCEEWVILDEKVIEELTEHFFGFDDVELIVEESLNTWKKVNGEWIIVS